MRFYFDGCDADLSLTEFLIACVLGISVVAVPLLIKCLLLLIY